MCRPHVERASLRGYGDNSNRPLDSGPAACEHARHTQERQQGDRLPKRQENEHETALCIGLGNEGEVKEDDAGPGQKSGGQAQQNQ